MFRITTSTTVIPVAVAALLGAVFIFRFVYHSDSMPSNCPCHLRRSPVALPIAARTFGLVFEPRPHSASAALCFADQMTHCRCSDGVKCVDRFIVSRISARTWGDAKQPFRSSLIFSLQCKQYLFVDSTRRRHSSRFGRDEDDSLRINLLLGSTGRGQHRGHGSTQFDSCTPSPFRYGQWP